MDTRESGPHIASLLAAGLTQAGATVAFAGVITTPGVACLVRQNDFQAGVVISASQDRKSTRLNSSHSQISYAVFCLKKKKNSNLASDALIIKVNITRFSMKGMAVWLKTQVLYDVCYNELRALESCSL